MGYRHFTTVSDLIGYLEGFSPSATVYILDSDEHLYDVTCDTGEIVIDIDRKWSDQSPVIGTCGEPFHEVIDEDVLNK